MKSIAELNKKLTEPSDRLVMDLSDMEGDIIILGVAGKMGASLATLAKNVIFFGRYQVWNKWE